MDPQPSDVLRPAVGLVAAPGPRARSAVEEERHARSFPAEAADTAVPVCPAEVEARLAVLLRWM